MKRFALIGLAAVISLAGLRPCQAGEIGYIEDFALATDRTVPLKQLIPGTQDYYYYHCLHYQNTAQQVEYGKMLRLWIKRYGRTTRVREIEHRQALLTYERDPAATLTYLRNQLGLRFDHQREVLGRKSSLPTRLDAKLIRRDTLTRRALSRHSKTVDGFEGRAYEWLISRDIGPDRLRHLLGRLTRPDLPNMARLVVADLNHKYSRGFGSLGIHRALLLDQLDECLELKVDLLGNTNFVYAYMSKLRPNPDADWLHDPDVRRAHLDRLWAFVSRLAPVHNSVKAHVLYRRLELDRSRGVYDKERFMQYIRLPRSVPYINPKYIAPSEQRRYMANLRADYAKHTMLPPIGADEALVRSYLQHFFVEEGSWKPYEKYIRDTWLKEVFAETKIVNGIGDMEKWYSMLSPSKYKQLKERVDLDFAHTNKKLFAADEAVALDVNVKNVKTLIIKVYRINALNYYRDKLQEVNTGVNLDGLVANAEQIHQYTEPPLRRVRRRFDFPSLAKRGVYVVDFIGNGTSSRALIRKGTLRHRVRTGTAGHVLTVLDGAHRKVLGANVWLGGHKYTADENGEVTVPFTNKPTRQRIVLTDGDFACLGSFWHEQEKYTLQAGVYVDREALLAGRKARVFIRPSLRVGSTPVTLKVLSEVTLLIQSTDHDGVTSTKTVKDFKLFEDRESSYEFRVPERLRRISFTLKAKVKNLSKNRKDDLAAGATFRLNEIDRTPLVEDLHLLHAGRRYALEVLGKSGESRPARPVHFSLKHRDFKDPVTVTLQTDARGRIELGVLKGIDHVAAGTAAGKFSHKWSLVRDVHNYRRNVHGKAGEALYVPYMGSAKQPDRMELSLLERRGSTYVKDWFGAMKIRDGFVVLEDLPAGDYSLLLKSDGTEINVRLAAGDIRGGEAVSVSRRLEVAGARPLQIESVEADANSVVVRLRNATKFTRVHVVATRYMPAYSLYAQMAAGLREASVAGLHRPLSYYVAGRDIGDEYRYILDRKYARKFPGNMLKHPGLLLNPWAIRKTDTGVQRGGAGEAFRRVGGDIGTGPAASFFGSGGGRAISPGPVANLDFLGEAAAVMINLEPDKDGVVVVPLKDLGAHHQVHVLAVDPENTVYRELSLAEAQMEFKDLSLRRGLDPNRHFAEQKRVSVVRAGGAFALDDISTSKFELYDSVAKAYGLYVTLSGNATLREFGFVLGWPKLKDEEKRRLYSKYACHELSFFLSRKDPAFFEKVILPYLRNKKDKTFMDRYLTGEDLGGYLKPWAHGQLNVAERILLGRRIAAEQPPAARHVKDLFDLIPPDIARFNHLFATALKGRALETDDELGLVASVRRLDKLDEKAKELASSRLARLGDVDKAGLRRRGAGLDLAKRPAAPAEPPMPAPAKPAPVTRAPSRKKSKAKDGKRAEAEDYYIADEGRRARARQFYRKLDKTQEWVENNYYHLPIEQQNAKLITVNGFWKDFAAHDGKGGFFSTNLAEASRNFPEMMLALAVLDLPFEAGDHKTDFQGRKMSLRAASAAVAFHKEILPAEAAAEKIPILVSQNFFRDGDRYRYVNNERRDKYVTDEFLRHVVYGCQVVITNPTSSPQKLDVLLQVPLGALPVRNGRETRSVHVDLQPYNTQTFEYYFYFPTVGLKEHYPVHVAAHGRLIASAEPVTLNVVAEPSKIDRTSWDYVSQHGTDEQVTQFLKQRNIGRVKLDRIAFRMKNEAYFRSVVELLARRHVYDHTLWSYGIRHGHVQAIREYLQHHGSFVSRCGAYLDSPLLTIDPVIRKTYQHMEYSPLVNARAHQLGRKRKIVNERLLAQYHRLMTVLSCRAELDADDLMSVTYYLLLQDRVAEAMEFFSRVDAGKLATRLQHDYFRAYVDFYSAKPTVARGIAEKYKDYPVDRWRKLFADVLNQVAEIESGAAAVSDEKDRTQKQTALAATEPSFEFKIADGKVTINYQNLAGCRVNYYLMDIELLFSRNPFVSSHGAGGQFSYIRPNATETVKLDAKGRQHAFKLPERFSDSNVLVEIVAAGQKKSQAYYSHSLAVQLIENYGQVRVTHAKTGKPLARVYVKVYAKMTNGQVRFFKDGYTDLRGRFDYISLNTNEIDGVGRLGLLVLSETNGAVIREAAPPKR